MCVSGGGGGGVGEYLHKIKPLKSKSRLNEASIWVYWTYNQICEINTYNDHRSIEMKLSLLEQLEEFAADFRLRRYNSILNKEKYM